MQVNLPRLKAMTWNMANQDMDLTDPVAVINLKVSNYMLLFECMKCFALLPLNRNVEVFDELYLVQLQNDAQSNAGDMDLKFQLAKGTLDTMLRSMSCIRDQLSDDVSLDGRDLIFLLDMPRKSLYMLLQKVHLLSLIFLV